MFLRRVLIPTIAGIPVVINFRRPIFNESEEDDAEWEKKKSECSFCRMFLESPCKQQFKAWSKCVDKAKSEGKEFKDECVEQSRALFTCTSDHHEYFKQLNDMMDGEDEEGAENDIDRGDDVSAASEDSEVTSNESNDTPSAPTTIESIEPSSA